MLLNHSFTQSITHSSIRSLNRPLAHSLDPSVSSRIRPKAPGFITKGQNARDQDLNNYLDAKLKSFKRVGFTFFHEPSILTHSIRLACTLRLENVRLKISKCVTRLAVAVRHFK